MFIQMDRKRPRAVRRWQTFFCFRNFKTYLQETTLHGLRFVGDDNLTIWERLFFLCAFIAAVCTTVHLIVYIYAKWESTPVIIGVDPFPVSISDIPFPSITICNMNRLMRSKVENFSKTSFEQAMIDMACFTQTFDKEEDMPNHYKNNNLSLQQFFSEHAQPCSRLIKACTFSSTSQTCSDLFRETLADEGLCCVFNLLHPKFRFKNDFQINREYTNTDGSIPVAWSPEIGYPKDLPEKFYPRTAKGIGVSMGLSVVLNAELDDYFCSSTNSAGFKISLHSPVEAPRVRDIGFIIGVGEETRVRIGASTSSAAPTIRPLRPESRLCLFGDEGQDLTVYKYYTRRNCENECQARYIYRFCQCIPYNLPMVLENGTVCGAPQYFCLNNAQNSWLRSKGGPCRDKCYSPCFDLTFGSTAFPAPLADGTYLVQDDAILRNMSRSYLRQNIAIIHFYYQEFVFHGNVRNVYVGFTEFLSNTGGILGLFLGFSFISLAEAFYYAFIRPIFWWKRPLSTKVAATPQQAKGTKVEAAPNTHSHWLGHEIFCPRREYILRTSANSKFYKFNLKKETGLALPTDKNYLNEAKQFGDKDSI